MGFSSTTPLRPERSVGMSAIGVDEYSEGCLRESLASQTEALDGIATGLILNRSKKPSNRGLLPI